MKEITQKQVEKEAIAASQQYLDRISLVAGNEFKSIPLAFRHGAQWAILQMQEQWVEIKSAKDYPKKDGHVLIYGRFTKDCPMNVYQALFKLKGGKFYSDGIISKGVTHWQPLPEPPRKEIEQ